MKSKEIEIIYDAAIVISIVAFIECVIYKIIF